LYFTSGIGWNAMPKDYGDSPGSHRAYVWPAASGPSTMSSGSGPLSASMSKEGDSKNLAPVEHLGLPAAKRYPLVI